MQTIIERILKITTKEVPSGAKHHASGTTRAAEDKSAGNPFFRCLRRTSLSFYVLYLGDRLDDLPFYLDYAKSAQTAVVRDWRRVGTPGRYLLQNPAWPIVAVDISRPHAGNPRNSAGKAVGLKIRQRVRIV